MPPGERSRLNRKGGQKLARRTASVGAGIRAGPDPPRMGISSQDFID